MIDAPATSHSYQGQDLFVLEILDGLRGGYFLDSGASNGVRGSNSLLLEEAYGWQGLCVEPNAATFAELVRNRRCRCVSCCLYDRDDEVAFVEAAGVLGGILDAYDPDHLRYTQDLLGTTWQTVPKPARTLRAVLREAGAPPIIDYWSLDTEGSELAILASFPFDEFRFRVLTVEHNYTPAREQIHALLERHGYQRVRSFGIDDGYVWNGDLPSSAWRSAAWRSPRRSAR